VTPALHWAPVLHWTPNDNPHTFSTGKLEL
jgi:hypothetical protein